MYVYIIHKMYIIEYIALKDGLFKRSVLKWHMVHCSEVHCGVVFYKIA